MVDHARVAAARAMLGVSFGAEQLLVYTADGIRLTDAELDVIDKARENLQTLLTREGYFEED